MKITEFSIRNPLVVAAITFCVVVFGVGAYLSLGVAITPNVNFPSVVVTTIYPGADPETIEANVTKPIEDAIATLPNIDANGLTSISSQGVSTVQVQFTSSANADLVGVDVERVVQGVRNKLPTDADPPTVTKVDINASGVATIVFSGPQQLTELQEYAENVLQKQFNALPGVGAANLRSGITREVQVQVDEEKLRARGLAINNVVTAVQTGQIETPAGSISSGTKDLSVYFDALARTPQAIGNLIVKQTTDAGAVRLRDVATIQETYKKRSTIVRVDGQEGISIAVVKLADANTIDVVDRVKAQIKAVEPNLPPGSRMDIVVDASTYTASSFYTVQKALGEAVFVTGLILLLFLHTWRSTLIVLVAIPSSLLITLTMMSLLHYNLNLLTMMGLTLSVGILVDDSIVVLENVSRHLGMGKTPFQAAIDGRAEIGLAALTITMVDVVVYLPIAVMISGIAAQFIAPFAVVIAVATLASLLVSFTLTPLLASRFLKPEDKTGNGPLDRFGRAWDRGFLWLEHRYQWLLRHALPLRWLVIAVGIGTFVFGIWLTRFIGSDFFPAGDQSEVDITIQMPASTSLDATNAVSIAMENRLRQYHEVRQLYSVVGSTAGGGPSGNSSGSNTTQITALLIPRHDRETSSYNLSLDMRRALQEVEPTAKVRVGLPNAFGFGGFGTQPIQVQVQGLDPAILNPLAAQVEAAVREAPGSVSIQNSNDNVQTQVRATIDWSRASDLGVTPQQAGIALRTAIDGFTSNANQFRQTGKTAIDIRILSSSARTKSLNDIARLPVVSSNGNTVQLDQFTTLRTVDIPTRIEHVNRLRSVTIGAEAGEGALVGDVLTRARQKITQISLPQGYAITYAGQAQSGGSAITDIAKALGIAVLLMYLLMMMLFGSLVLPLSVMMSLPLALVGAFGAMVITGSPFTIFSMLGIAVLVGLVGKNAILLVDYTEILMQRGMSRNEALLEAGPTRLRPIIMTTMSVMAALLPIASGLEEGSELLKSAAVVLIGGLITSTLLTLVFVPAMFTVFDDLQHFIKRLFTRRPSKPTQAKLEARPEAAD